MNISILYKFRKGPWGGTNQFLQALRKEFFKMEVYEEDMERTDAILFNSYPVGSEYLFEEILKLKKKYPSKIIIYRLNGPISLYRGRDKEVDKVIALFNNLFADGIIFQSNWCRIQNRKYFNIFSRYETVIHNAPGNEIFNKKEKKQFNPNGKINLVATSWSSNWRKGFEIYKFLDENLDFSRYNMTFIGNSPIRFEKIKWIKPIPSEKVAEILKEHDIYITASQNDPCSNSLIEALSCDLPAVALSDAGHPELVENGGELFNGKKDVIEKIDDVAANYFYYQSRIPEFSIKEVSQAYYEFAMKIYNDVQKRIYQPKKVNFSTRVSFYRMMKLMIVKWKIFDRIKSIWKV